MLGELSLRLSAAVLVLDTPYFTRSSPDGAFRLVGLPAGNFVLKAWFNENVVLEKPVTLKAGQTLRVDGAAAVATR